MAYYSNNIENISIADLKSSQVLRPTMNRYSANNSLVSTLPKTISQYSSNVPAESQQHVAVSSVLTVRQTPAVARNPQFSNTVMTPPLQQTVLKTSEAQKDQERRIRREIANSNERRRMQSINSGFKSLKAILPHGDDEKLSKAAILQQTSDYIYQLESEKNKLGLLIDKMRNAFGDCKCKHRTIFEISEKDEGIGSPLAEDYDDMRRNVIELRKQLDKERRLRMILEEQVRKFQSELYPDKNIKEAGEIILEEVKQFPKFDQNMPPARSLDHNTHSRSPKVRVITSPEVLPPVPPLTKSCAVARQRVPSPTATVFIPPNDVKPENIMMRDTTVLTSMSVAPPAMSNENVLIPPISNVFSKGTSKITQNVSYQQSPALSRSNQPLKKRPVEVLNEEETVILPKVPKTTVVFPNLPTKCAVPCSRVETPNANMTSQNIISPNHHNVDSFHGNNLNQPPSTTNCVLPASGNVVVMSAAQWCPRSPTQPQFIQSPVAQQIVPTQFMPATIPSPTQTQTIPTAFNARPVVLAQVSNEIVTNNAVFATSEKEITLNQLNTVTMGYSTCATTCPQFVNKIMSPPRHQETYLPQPIILPVPQGYDTADKTTKIQPVEGNIEQPALQNVIENESIPTRHESVEVETTPPPVIESEELSDDATEIEIEPSEVCVPNGGSSPESSSSIDTHSRRNLDAIVQAIDHIEQQERRNSQDSSASDATS